MDCNDQDELSMQRRAFHGYAEWVRDWMDKEHKVYLLTFMFEHMSGSRGSINARMIKDVGLFWRTLSKWIVRQNRTAPHHLLPKLIAFPDRPVFKWEKQTLARVAINDGRHVHGTLAIPRTTRMKEDLADHVASRSVYTDATYTRIRHIDVKPITSRPAYVAGYVTQRLEIWFCGYRRPIDTAAFAQRGPGKAEAETAPEQGVILNTNSIFHPKTLKAVPVVSTI
jgi:hypothetical protein